MSCNGDAININKLNTSDQISERGMSENQTIEKTLVPNDFSRLFQRVLSNRFFKKKTMFAIAMMFCGTTKDKSNFQDFETEISSSI